MRVRFAFNFAVEFRGDLRQLFGYPPERLGRLAACGGDDLVLCDLPQARNLAIELAPKIFKG